MLAVDQSRRTQPTMEYDDHAQVRLFRVSGMNSLLGKFAANEVSTEVEFALIESWGSFVITSVRKSEDRRLSSQEEFQMMTF